MGEGAEMFGLNRIASQAIGAVALLLALWWGVHTVLGWKEERDTLRQQVQSLQQTEQAAGAIGGAAGVAVTQARQQQGAIERVRQQTRNNYEQAINTDTSVRDWASQPVPERLRELAREQRIERERLGSDALRDTSADATAHPPR